MKCGVHVSMYAMHVLLCILFAIIQYWLEFVEPVLINVVFLFSVVFCLFYDNDDDAAIIKYKW